MAILQRSFKLREQSYGFHVITDEVLDNVGHLLEEAGSGLVTLNLLHTSASLSTNEAFDSNVLTDMNAWFDRKVKKEPYFEHIYEGDDDMSAHIKSSLLGQSVTLPISGGRLQLGTWQGIYLGEHRLSGGMRTIVATIVY